jgi:hypothetical protein
MDVSHLQRNVTVSDGELGGERAPAADRRRLPISSESACTAQIGVFWGIVASDLAPGACHADPMAVL